MVRLCGMVPAQNMATGSLLHNQARLTETYTVVLGWVSPASVALVVFPWPLDKFQKDGREVEAANMTTFCRMLQNVQVEVWL